MEIESLRFREKNFPKNIFSPVLCVTIFFTGYLTQTGTCPAGKGNFLSKIEVNVPPQSIARPTRDKFDVETF